MNRGYMFGYLLTLSFILWLLSLATSGFVNLFYYAVKPFSQLPYAILALNVIGGLLYLNEVLNRVIRGRTGDPIVDAVIDVIVVIPLFFVGWVGAAYPLLASLIVSSDEGSGKKAVYFGLGVILLLLIVPIVVYSPFSASKNIEAIELDTAVNVYGVYRLVPLYTAYIYGIDRVQLPTHTLYINDSHLYYDERTPVYNWIIEPEGFFNQFLRKPRGLVLVEGDRFPPNVTIINKELKYGIHNKYFKILYIDSLARQAKLHAIGKEVLLNENIEKIYNGTVYIIIPVIKWERGITYSIPVPDSFIVVDENGDVTVVPYNEAIQNPLFEGVPLVPEKVAREWVEFYNYRTGIVAYYLQHNRYRIPDVGNNPQPYLTVSDDGELYWTFVVEPYGETYSVKHIIYVKAQAPSTSPQIMLYTPKTSLVGVSKITSYVQSKHPNYDWTQVRVVEPIPTIVNDTIYWKVSIITNDYRGLVAIDLVDARTTQIKTITPSNTTAVTADDILALIVKPTQYPAEQEENATGIIEEINKLKRMINETIEYLNELYKRLNELERILNETSG